MIYTNSTAKIAEHGGFSHDDTNVAMLIAGPTTNGAASAESGSHGRVIAAPVRTSQIAPTILKVLGVDPGELTAVRQEHTTVLPGVGQGE